MPRNLRGGHRQPHILLIQDENQTSNKNRIHRSEQGGVLLIFKPRLTDKEGKSDR